MFRLSRASAVVALTAAFTFSANLVHAQERVVFDFDGPRGENGLPARWSLKRWSPWTGLGDFEIVANIVQDGGEHVLHVRSVKSGFFVGTKRQVDVSRFRKVTWRWRIERLPTGASFRQRSTNDQAVQILFAFAGGRVLGYIWDSTGQPGASGSGLSWQEDTRVIVVEAGPSKLSQWVSESRNLYDDFRLLFEEDPPTIEGVAIQSNSQHTDSAGEGYVGPITLSP